MWQRFGENARRIIFYGQEQAVRFGVIQVDTEHLLLGLVREEKGMAGRVLRQFGVDLEAARIVAAQLPPGTLGRMAGETPWKAMRKV